MTACKPGRSPAFLMVLLLSACASRPLELAERADRAVHAGPTVNAWQQPHPALATLRYAPLPDSVVHVLRVDLQQPGLRLRVSPEAERGQTVAALPSSAGALLSINASFFDKQFTPRGLTVSDGVAWLPVLNPQSSPLLACDAQPRCVIQHAPPFELQPGWFNVVAGTPWLVDAGRPRSPHDDAGCASLCAALHPRTAAGLDASGRYLFLVLAEGRRPPVLGLSLAQLAAVMLQLGVHQAFNLDGGGSSTLLLMGESRLARPFNEPALRRVANALQIFMPTPHGSP